MEIDVRASGNLSATNPSVGTTGAVAPANATEVGGVDGTGNLRALLLDSAGNLANLPLPAGAATAAKQDTGNTSLATIASTVATAANQTAQQALIGPVTETAPATDTASSGLNGRLQRIAQRLTTIIALFPTSLGQKTSAASLAVVLSSDQEPLIGALTETAPVSDTASSGLNGRLQRIAQRLTSLIALLPGSLGQKTMSASFAVAIASDQSAVPVSGTFWQATQPVSGTVAATQSGTWTVQPGNTANTTPWLVKLAGKASANTPVYNDYGTTPVTTSAYVQLVASLTSACTEIEINETGGNALYLATGAAASEVNQIIIPPGGNTRIPLAIAAGTRISVKAVATNSSTSGSFLIINFYA